VTRPATGELRTGNEDGPAVWLASRLRSAFVLLGSQFLVLVIAACSAPGGGPRSERPPASEKPLAAPKARPVLAEADRASPRVRVQVTEVFSSGPEAITVKLRLLNPDRTAAVTIGDAFADMPGDTGSISGVYLIGAAGRKKSFVFRDDQGQPECSAGLGPLPPGGEIEAWGRYPAPDPGATRVTVQVPGLAGFRDLTVAAPPRGTGSAGPSY
jgi:hypothetical protein